MPFEFVGGARNGTFTNSEEFMEELIAELKGCQIKVDGKPTVIERYDLLEDGKLHHIKTAKLLFKGNGDPCPTCGGTSTTFVRQDIPQTVTRSIGGAISTQSGTPQITIKCEKCGIVRFEQ